MRSRLFLLSCALLIGSAALLSLLSALNGRAAPVLAEPARLPEPAALQNTSLITRYVALSGSDTTTCTWPLSPCRTVQYGVDVAEPGDTILVAQGTYTGVNSYGGLSQVVYLTKTLTLRGGYTTTDWSGTRPVSYPTTLDAEGQGRVIYVAGEISPIIEGFRITGGNAAGLGSKDGGGIYIDGGFPVINDNVFQSNESERFGGGVAAYTALTTTLNRNRFVANTAAGGGGACVWRAILSDNAFISNTVVGDGGAVYVNGYGTIRQNAFVSNTAGWNGGAVFHLGGIEYVDQYIENTFSGNEARHGGALFLDASNVLLERNTFVSNIADQDGGAVIGLADSGVRFVNSQVVDNYAGNSGSGLFIGTSSLDILHATIARNTGGDGSGIYVNDGSVALTNTLIASQTVGIYVTNGQTATLEGTGWGAGVWANGVDWAGAGTILTGTVNVWGAPAFVDPDGGNYHISVHSAAVDAGVDAGVVTDIDGEERPIGFGPDIGADEVWRRIYSFYLPILHR